MAKITRVDWAKGLCDWMNFPKVKDNLWALVAWQAAEGTEDGAKFNPLNCILVLAGSTYFNVLERDKNGKPLYGVQNYTNLEQGYEATSRTLRQLSHPSFAPIRHSLLEGKPADVTLEFVEASEWGTGGNALKILDDVKKYWKRDYAFVLIGQ